MVCAFLKISRKTLWERRRKAALHFPRPVNLGGSRNVYRASAVRDWVEAKALAELCELG
jgi:predicted DNA-binding transcriptional regulator AlpA